MSAKQADSPTTTRGNGKNKKRGKKRKSISNEDFVQPDARKQQPAAGDKEPPTPTAEAASNNDDEEDRGSDTEAESREMDLPLRGSIHQPKLNGTAAGAAAAATTTAATSDATTTAGDSTNATARFDAMTKERDSLKAEVVRIRKELETFQGGHESELAGLNDKLKESQSEKEHAETQYKTLLGRVNTIRSQLGDRLKADAEQLSQSRAQVEELETENKTLNEANESTERRLAEAQAENERQAAEVADLRSRASLSQQNWSKERDELVSREASTKEEFENAKQAMQDWEVLAIEERSMRENLKERLSELEERFASQAESHDHLAVERDANSSTIEGLQRALQEIQEERKRELRDIVEKTTAETDSYRKRLADAEESAQTSQTLLEETRAELEKFRPFEKEVKEKNLQIGKLRHQCVILNDHLRKAFRMLKKGDPEDHVDRQIVTNYLLQFLALDRSDAKKFEVLQLIALVLGWTDEQKEKAGLARPGGALSSSSLRVPLSSPFRRTPSTPSLNSSTVTDPMLGATRERESLAELWSEFLERESAEGSTSGGGGGGVLGAGASAGALLRHGSAASASGSAAGLGIQSGEGEGEGGGAERSPRS